MVHNSTAVKLAFAECLLKSQYLLLSTTLRF